MFHFFHLCRLKIGMNPNYMKGKVFFMNLTETKVDSKEIYNGKVLKLMVDDIKLPDGSPAKREVIRHSGAVCIAPVTQDGNLIFVRQFRYAVGQALLELPAGRIDPNEDPQVTGERELKEETGYTAENTKRMGCLFPTPGYSDEIIWLFACNVSAEKGVTHFDEGEIVETLQIPVDKAYQMVLDDEIFDSKTQILILRLKAAIDQGIF